MLSRNSANKESILQASETLLKLLYNVKNDPNVDAYIVREWTVNNEKIEY